MAAKTAKYALMVTNAERFGMEAIPLTLEFIEDVRENYDHQGLSKIGLIFNDYDRRRKVVRNQTADLMEAQAAGDITVDVPVWDERIPDRGVIADAQDAAAPLSALLGDASSRKAATVVCKVVESIALRLLNEIGHPRAAELQAHWKEAWPKEEKPGDSGDQQSGDSEETQ
jgi:cellulose biosynthesis protein BcsQ